MSYFSPPTISFEMRSEWARMKKCGPQQGAMGKMEDRCS